MTSVSKQAYSRVYVIAEAGVCHNGSLELARRMVDAARRAGADAVKFQSFRAVEMVCRTAPKAAYQLETTAQDETQFDMLRRLELDEASHAVLARHCRENGIEFLSTPFDLVSLGLLTERIGVQRIKLASSEITNAPLLLAAARTRRSVILSTGMSALAEVKTALGVLAFGYVRPVTVLPSVRSFEDTYWSSEGQAALLKNVTLLHCTSEYPARYEDVNLRAMQTLREAFGLPTGISDHTPGSTVPVAAVALGAVVVEKHFTLDRELSGPDHNVALTPDELTAMVRGVREVEAALGSPIKSAAEGELEVQKVARKSLVAARPIVRGEVFSEQNLGVKRPGSGVSPLSYWETLGKVADRDYQSDELIVL